MEGRNHVVWVLTTQWRAMSCGYAGDVDARTPALDAFAAEAVNYAEAVTPHPFGPFARAALLTGLPSPENGVREYFDPLPIEARTIAHWMHGRGFSTAWFGKWHLGRRDPAAPLVGEAHARIVVPEGERGGFAFWEGFESGFLLQDPWLHGSRLPEPVCFPGYQSDVLCERAAAWLAERTTPTFCVVSLEAPHPPYAAPAAGIAARDPASLTLAPNVPRGGEVEARARRELAGYHAHLEATDRAIGRLIAVLGPEAIVVVTSVHGDMHGAHGRFRKGWPHEESVRVPLLVRAPGLPRGAVSREPVSLLDLPALTAALVEGRRWRCGRDHATISMPSVVALPDQCDRVWSGVRAPGWKMVLTADGRPWLSVDLERDPHELGAERTPGAGPSTG